MHYYQLAPPVGSIDARSSLKEVSKIRNKEEKDVQNFFLFVGPAVIFILVALHSILLVFVDETGEDALYASILFVLPFAIAFALAHASRVIVELIIVFLRYAFQESRP